LKSPLLARRRARFIAANVKARRIFLTLYVVLLGTLGVLAAKIFYDARQEYNELKRTEAASRMRLAEAEARLREQQKILDRLETDPAFVEKVIRKRLGYARPGEVIFRFED